MNEHCSNSSRHRKTAGSPLPLLQFRLKTLLITVALCSVAFAVMTWIGAVWSMVLLFFVFLIVGHVAGNAIGTRLRDGRPKRSPPKQPPTTGVVNPAPPKAGETPRLGESSSLHRVAFVSTLAGGAGGVLAGRWIFIQIDHGQLGVADWTLALISFAVIGGFFAFLASSFFQIGLWPAAVCFFDRKHGQAEFAPILGESGE